MADPDFDVPFDLSFLGEVGGEFDFLFNSNDSSGESSVNFSGEFNLENALQGDWDGDFTLEAESEVEVPFIFMPPQEPNAQDDFMQISALPSQFAPDITSPVSSAYPPIAPRPLLVPLSLKESNAPQLPKPLVALRTVQLSEEYPRPTGTIRKLGEEIITQERKRLKTLSPKEVLQFASKMVKTLQKEKEKTSALEQNLKEVMEENKRLKASLEEKPGGLEYVKLLEENVHIKECLSLHQHLRDTTDKKWPTSDWSSYSVLKGEEGEK